MTKLQLIASGIRVPEGPVWRPSTGDLLVTDVCTGNVLRIDLASGLTTQFADTAGGPNGLILDAENGVVVAQNGGLDFFGLEKMGFKMTPDPVPARFIASGLQHLDAAGTLTTLFSNGYGFQAPNDLVVGHDGSLWFTDPPGFPWPAQPSGRVWRVPPGKKPEVVLQGLVYPNGIGIEPDGTVLIVEKQGLLRLHDDGTQSWLIEDMSAGGDGFAFDAEGNVYVAQPATGNLLIISPDGKILDCVEVPGGLPTNCCFGGDDLRTLFITGPGSQGVFAWEGVPTPGLPMQPYQLSG